MKYSFASLAFAASAYAAVLDRACTFTISASGGQTGVLGSLADGQIRVGSGLPIQPATFSINNGQITDSQGRGCILTPPTTQFQCDTGATPASGFVIGSNGVITSNGSPTFYACPASNTQYNIYTTPVAGQNKCVQVTLTASGCFAASPAAPAPAAPKTITTFVTATSRPAAPPTVTVTQPCAAPSTVTRTVVVTAQAPAPAPSTAKTTAPAPAPAPTASTPPSTGKTCPANLSGSYQFPHLIVPVDSSKPNTAPGTSYNGQVSSTVSSIFNFDIPASYTGTCSLVFLFPQQKDLQTSSFTFSGPGTIDFVQLNNVASKSTTFANQGSVKTDFGVKTVTPGTSTVVTTFACPAGQAVSYQLKSVGGTSLTYFQDYNPSPIGLYITTC